MHNLWRHTGKIMTGIGIFHVILFIGLFYQVAWDMLRSGAFNTVGQDAERGLFWYDGMFTGLLMILLGLLMTSWTSTTGRPVPRYLAITLVVAGVVLIAVDPVSGGWLILIAGVLSLLRPAEPGR